ncbi:cytochrome P450 [Saccharopolyspora taberi]|uniref:Cytochrome P450 n=1 Tax=Saccharopolyspora taberi TaxID=60895 RepID=A0ABN3VEL6_9PSEU
MPEVPFLDLTHPDFSFDSPEVAEARERSWYARTPVGIIVLRYAEVRELLHDRRLAQDGRRYMELNGITSGPVYDWFVPLILHRNGDDHVRLRRVVQKAFTPRRINELRPFMRETATALAERIAESGECDFVEAFADPLPVAVMSRLLGVPPEDYDVFHGWSTDIGLVFSLTNADVYERVERAVVELHGYVDSLIAQRRSRPEDDLLSTLVAAQQEENRLDAEELRNLVVSLVFAGHDTTRHQLGLAMVALCAHPEQWSALRDDPEPADRAVDEILRWSPAAPAVFRFALQDFDYQGLHIPAGTFVMLGSHPAHHDPRVFEGGDSFDITATRPAGHLTFGAGPHYCLGAATARAEIAEALPALASTLGTPNLAGPVSWRSPIGVYGPTSVPVRFGPSPA